MKLVKFLFLSTFLFTILISQSYAKWAKISDAPTKDSYIQTFTINADGTYEAIKEVSKIILTEIGRNNATNFVLSYNGDSEKIEIIEAKTVYKGEEYKVAINKIAAWAERKDLDENKRKELEEIISKYSVQHP